LIDLGNAPLAASALDPDQRHRLTSTSPEAADSRPHLHCPVSAEGATALP